MIILAFLIYKNKIANEKREWHRYIVDLINSALFDDPEDGEIAKPVIKILKTKRFRACLIDEIIHTKKNLSGDAGMLLKNFYESLELHLDSAEKLKSYRWHVKTKGIQELSTMEQTGYVKKIFRLTNDRNQFVRNAAQCGLVSFYGFRGLRFLNVMAHPISQWQQILLLNKLNATNSEDLTCIHKWLQSQNESVVIFSLKLATHYNCLDVFDDVMKCFEMRNPAIKIHVIKYLLTMPNENTGDLLVKDYHLQNKMVKLYILDALKEVGNTNHVHILIEHLHDADEEITKATLATIMALNPLGKLQSSLVNTGNHTAFVHRINNEHAA